MIAAGLTSGWVDALGWTLLNSVWQGAMIALLVLVLNFSLRHASAHARYAVSCLSLLTVFLLAVFTFIRLTCEQSAVSVVDGTSQSSSVMMMPMTPGFHAPAGAVSLAAVTEDALPWLVGFWLAGVVMLSAWHLGGLVYIRRIRRRYSIPAGQRISQILGSLSARLGLDKKVAVMESLAIKVPVVVGYFRPAILLPFGLAGNVPVQQLESILVHELIHILRRDFLVNILQTIVEALLFFNPAVWWISGCIRIERENICDDLTIQHIHDPIHYIKALTAMQERSNSQKLPVPALLTGRRKLLDRVRRITGHKHSGSLVYSLAFTGIIFLMLLTAAFTIDKESSDSLAAYYAGIPIHNAVSTVSHDESVQDVYAVKELQRIATITPGTQIDRDVNRYTDAAPDTVIKPGTDAEKSEALRQAREAYEHATQEWQEALARQRQAWEEYHMQLQEQKANARTMRIHMDTGKDLFGEIYKEIIVIKDGDTVVIHADPIPGDVSFDYDFDFEGSLPPVPDDPALFFIDPDLYLAMPPDVEELDSLPGLESWHGCEPQLFYHYDLGPDIELDRQLRHVEREMRIYRDDADRLRKEIQIERGEGPWRHVPPADRHIIKWYGGGGGTERIIRQELMEDGLVIPGKDYVIELDTNGMYINGVKQPKELHRKYRKLYEGLESEMGPGNESYKLVF